MKIRWGFVSNSSSSSFLAVGRPITVEGAIRGENKHPVFGVGCIAWSGYLDIIEITDEMLEMFASAFLPRDIKLYEIAASNYGEKLPLPILHGQGWIVLGGEADHHNTETVKDLKENYFDEKEN